MQILLMVGGFDVDGGVELILVDVNIDIQEGDMGLGDVPGEVYRIATVEPFKEGDEGVWTMWYEKHLFLQTMDFRSINNALLVVCF